MLGPAVERVFTRRTFWVVYTLGALAASAGSLTWRTWGPHPGFSLSVGASGAIFALGGALLAAAVRLRHRLAPSRARALGAGLLYLAGTGLASGFTEHGTDNAAHVAGLGAGIVLGALLPLNPRLGWRPPAGCCSALALACVLALALALALAVRGGLGLG